MKASSKFGCMSLSKWLSILTDRVPSWSNKIVIPLRSPISTMSRRSSDDGLHSGGHHVKKYFSYPFRTAHSSPSSLHGHTCFSMICSNILHTQNKYKRSFSAPDVYSRIFASTSGGNDNNTQSPLLASPLLLSRAFFTPSILALYSLIPAAETLEAPTRRRTFESFVRFL